MACREREHKMYASVAIIGRNESEPANRLGVSGDGGSQVLEPGNPPEMSHSE